MDKPDLHELAANVVAVRGALDDLVLAIDNGMSAALGEWDEERDEAIEGTGSGDDPMHFESARKHLNAARGELAAVEDILATVQGHRDFAESGSVPA